MSDELTLNFSHKWFSKVFYKLQAVDTRFTILYGGASSSKSYSKHQQVVIGTYEKNHRKLIIRKHAADLKESSYQLCLDIIKAFGREDDFICRLQPLSITNRITGSKILFRGLDDNQKIKSITRIKDIIVEEASEITEADFLELNTRVRGIKDVRITLIFNPIIETHWIKKVFFDSNKYENQTTKIHCTYKDNLKFLTEEDVYNLEITKDIDYQRYRVYTLGKWGKMEIKSPYAFNFEYDRHVKPCQFHAHYQHCISIDFNLEPLVCELMIIDRQTQGSRLFHVYDEIALDTGDVFILCDHIRANIHPMILTETWFTGDATGQSREVTQKNNMSAWDIVRSELNIPPARLHLNKVNPRVNENRHLVNAILARHPDFRIDERCTVLVRELEITEADHDGNIIKSNRNREQERADALDCLRYAFNTWQYNFIKNNVYLRKERV